MPTFLPKVIRRHGALIAVRLARVQQPENQGEQPNQSTSSILVRWTLMQAELPE
jgi:hypothetical protein